MRIVAWNLGHQTHEREIPIGFVAAVGALSPDVLVLNEYVHGETRTPMVVELARLGLASVSVSSRLVGENQVLIASRDPLSDGDLSGPSTTPAASVNFLHVTVPGLEIVGMRAPAYKDRARLEAYWNETENLIAQTSMRRIVFIGDMNCNPGKPQKPGGRALSQLLKAGWQIPSPPQDSWSFISKDGSRSSRIDHAICSPKLPCPAAQYVSKIGDVIVAGHAAENAISDHAALVVDFST